MNVPVDGLPDALCGLLEPSAYPHAVRRVELRQTHISWVFLTGEFAYKLKRPVRLPFVDQRSPEQRLRLCEEELRLNRRFAPGLYLDVCAVVEAGSSARIVQGALPAGARVIDHAVRMKQFDTGAGLDALLSARAVDEGDLREFGGRLAAVHATLPVATMPGPWGNPEETWAAMQRNLAQCRACLSSAGQRRFLDALRELMTSRYGRLRAGLVARWGEGRVRECHGDLHAGNVARVDGRLVAFDCLEFQPAFRWQDVAHETAFLAMDLEARGAREIGIAFLSGYCDASGDHAQLRAMPLFMADRAIVRAKVAAIAARERAGAPGRTADDRVGPYLAVAEARLLAPSRPRRITAMYGVSGSGKTWLASQLARELGAVHLRSDILRRHLPRAGSEAARGVVQGGDYCPGRKELTYERLSGAAAAALEGGFDVIADASYMLRADRAGLARLAARYGATLRFVRCRAPEPVLRRRIDGRLAEGRDASEATQRVLDWQLAHVEGIDDSEDLRVIDADTTRPGIVAEIATLLS